MVKQRIIFMLAVCITIVAVVVYSQLWSAPALARKTGAAFLSSAVQGDQIGVQ